MEGHKGERSYLQGSVEVCYCSLVARVAGDNDGTYHCRVWYVYGEVFVTLMTVLFWTGVAGPCLVLSWTSCVDGGQLPRELGGSPLFWN